MIGLAGAAAALGGLAAGQPPAAQVAAAVRLITDPNQLRDLARALAKDPLRNAPPVRFRLELPLADDTKHDIVDLENSAGWRVSGPTFLINFDMGVVTPQNFNAFEKDDLFNAPPLRVTSFWTRRYRSQTFRQVPTVRGDDVEGGVGWYEPTETYGLAVATSAQARAVGGGDLPDNLTLPFALQFPRPPGSPAAVAAGLRIRWEGELRTMRGRAVLCGDQRNGVGYAADVFTQKAPYTLSVHQCLLPAVVTRISLVRTTGGPPLRVWTRAERPPTPESEDTRVLTQRDSRVIQAPDTPSPIATSPNATQPLTKRP